MPLSLKCLTTVTPYYQAVLQNLQPIPNAAALALTGT